MSSQEINEAIAKACGRQRNPDGGWYPDNGLRVGTQAIPDYCGDLNAMHEAENVLDETQAEDYEELLRGYGFHATARERAEAFLRTLKAAEVRERNEILQQLNRIAQLQRWIPVEERLPKSYLTVLSLSRNKDIKLDFVQPKNIWYLGRNNVTHWMPLPEPPKEVQG
jgi:hypothetical protein